MRGKKKSSSQTKKKSSSARKTKSQFGYLEKISFAKASNRSKGQLLGVFGLACNSASGCSVDPYGNPACFMGCDDRC